MQENQILSAVTEVLVDKPLFTISINIDWQPPVKRSLLDRLLRRPVPAQEKVRDFVIHPCKVANMYRIAGRAALLPKEINGGSAAESILPVIYEHLDNIIYIVAAGIQNNHEEPKPELIEFIRNNFDAIDLYKTLEPVLENVNMQAFLNSIVLARGTVRILTPTEETSPEDGRE